MIVDIIIFIAVLAVLVLVHEFGHYLVAKKSGMYVEEFGFGFPPRLFSWKKGETVWSINAIPLGGFVKIAGEDNETADSTERIADSKNNSSETDISIEEREIKITTQGEIYEKDIFIEEKFFPNKEESLQGRFFHQKPFWKKTLVLMAGVIMNFIFGWILLAIVFSFGVEKSLLVLNVASNSPAEKSGVISGDKILDFSDVESFVSFVSQNKGKEITFFIERGGDKKEIKVIPRIEVPAGQGATGVELGVAGIGKMPFFQAIWESLKSAAGMFVFIYVMLFKLIASIFSGGDLFSQVSGPIGIFKVTSQAASWGILSLLNLVALISINLAAINIFPFPALDGGRLVMLTAEKIKGKPISASFQQIVNGIGFALLILLIIFISIQDIRKFF
ncbi:MAG: RIP metalloprotease RseP [Candidatus Paceibacterota bacterium]|jgi:regulator of sigma E protease